MGKSTNRKRDRNQVATAHTTPQIQGSEMTQMDILQTQTNTLSTNLDFDADEEWLDDEVTDRDNALIQGLIVAIARNDVAMVDKFVTLLPTSNLSLDTVSFRDTGTGKVYSMLGVAKSLRANRVAAYLMSSGLKEDFIDDGGIFH